MTHIVKQADEVVKKTYRDVNHLISYVDRQDMQDLKCSFFNEYPLDQKTKLVVKMTDHVDNITNKVVKPKICMHNCCACSQKTQLHNIEPTTDKIHCDPTPKPLFSSCFVGWQLGVTAPYANVCSSHVSQATISSPPSSGGFRPGKTQAW